MPDAERLTDERVREIAEDRAVAFHTDELRALAREVLAARRTDATAPLSDEEREFAAWLTREMPPGTVIGNPEWWAVRIWSQLSRLAARAGDREEREGAIERRLKDQAQGFAFAAESRAADLRVLALEILAAYWNTGRANVTKWHDFKRRIDALDADAAAPGGEGTDNGK